MAVAVAESTVFVNVGGKWETSVTVTDTTTWSKLKDLIAKKTGIQTSNQRLTPSGVEGDKGACGLRDGDEVRCEWTLAPGKHPLHEAGEGGRGSGVSLFPSFFFGVCAITTLCFPVGRMVHRRGAAVVGGKRPERGR